MKYTLTVQTEDYGFIVEAIKLRALILTEALEKQVEIQEREKKELNFSFSAAPVKHEGAPVTYAGEVAKKKPHWTQTAKGKKIMAARKRKGTK
jgi:hypothetical protein